MVVIGKPMGNGHPMGAVITNEEISNSFEMGVEFSAPLVEIQFRAPLENLF